MPNKHNDISGMFLSPNDLYGIFFNLTDILFSNSLFLWILCVCKCVCLSIWLFFFVLGCKLIVLHTSVYRFGSPNGM